MAGLVLVRSCTGPSVLVGGSASEMRAPAGCCVALSIQQGGGFDWVTSILDKYPPPRSACFYSCLIQAVAIQRKELPKDLVASDSSRFSSVR